VIEQLELALGDVRLSIPWGGQSPRVLTKAYNALFSRREPQNDDGFFASSDQLEMFGEAKKVSGRTPTLLPLPRKGLSHLRRV